MSDAAAARRLGLALPEVQAVDGEDGALALSVRGRKFAWSYLERLSPKAPRRLRTDVLAVRCTPGRKEMLLEAAPEVFFEDDHYRGYPAVLVRLALVEEAELASLLEEGWRLQAPSS